MNELVDNTSNADIQDAVTRIRRLVDHSTTNNEGSRFTYLIGNNGVGKSRILAELARQYDTDQNTRIKTIPCITDSIYDKFAFGRRNRRIRYFGARNAANAVFQSAIERALAAHILNGIVEKTQFVSRLEKIIEMTLELRVAGAHRLDDERKTRVQTLKLEDFVDKRKLKTADFRSKISEDEEQIIKGLLFTRIIPSKLTKLQASALRSFIELNPEMYVLVTKPGMAKPFSFGELSSGEKSRTLFAAKLLVAANNYSLILIDEPENSLHLHWQLNFHDALVDMLSGIRNFHVVVATHSPIIVSQSAKPDTPDTEVLVLYEDGAAQDKVQVSLSLGSQIDSYDEVLLDFFDTATFQTKSIKEKVADVMVKVADDPSSIDACKEELERLLAKKGIDNENLKLVNSAISLLKKHFGASNEKDGGNHGSKRSQQN
ncbi:AAA family ATPase [Massilia oculi]|uniref:AAA family ATPase n=1 Tax=Massilia oculi TaxID=945844 RepID=UPI0028AAD383|nr:AAA family ATPase [Massilia oculi]